MKRLVQVFRQRSVPTTTGCFYAAHPVDLFGGVGEGVAPGLAADTSVTMYVYVAGGRPPVAGDYLLAHEVIGIAPGQPGTDWARTPYWAAERLLPNSGGGGGAVGCYCASIPPALTMSSSNHAANGGMFQDAALAYGPTPAGYNGLGLGASCYLSTASYLDQFHDSFRYYFYCQRNQFFLSRVYVNSVFGSPFADGVRYLWTMTSAGNSCSPFLLSNGQIYSGGDASSVVTISA